RTHNPFPTPVIECTKSVPIPSARTSPWRSSFIHQRPPPPGANQIRNDGRTKIGGPALVGRPSGTEYVAKVLSRGRASPFEGPIQRLPSRSSNRLVTALRRELSFRTETPRELNRSRLRESVPTQRLPSRSLTSARTWTFFRGSGIPADVSWFPSQRT